MKKKLVFVNLVLMMTVLFSILYQSFDHYEHYQTQLLEKKCHHKYNSLSEITHNHHGFEHCFVCDFTLSHFIYNTPFCFELYKINTSTSYCCFESKEIAQFFRGSLFALRAPPGFIV